MKELPNTIRTRIAPTPSGLPHLGNAVSFLLTWAITRAQNGHMLLRIDDLDTARIRPEYLEDIFRTLEWLGIDWDEGPAGPDDFQQHFSQHLRIERYLDYIQQLKSSGYLFACTCSRKQIREKSRNGLYPGTCRAKNIDWENKNTAWRIRVPQHTSVMIPEWRKDLLPIALAEHMGDVVLRQKNGFPAYQIASLADDTQWKINFIVRGEDLLYSTAMQLFLANLLDLPDFSKATFYHHELIKNRAGEKLSKTKGAGSLREWRKAGKDISEIYQLAAKLLGDKKNRVMNGTDLIQIAKAYLD